MKKEIYILQTNNAFDLAINGDMLSHYIVYKLERCNTGESLKADELKEMLLILNNYMQKGYTFLGTINKERVTND